MKPETIQEELKRIWVWLERHDKELRALAKDRGKILFANGSTIGLKSFKFKRAKKAKPNRTSNFIKGVDYEKVDKLAEE